MIIIKYKTYEVATTLKWNNAYEVINIIIRAIKWTVKFSVNIYFYNVKMLSLYK